MNIVFVSALCSVDTINTILNKYKEKPLQSIQRYHRLLCEGFVKNNVNVKTISSIPLVSGKRKLILNKKSEKVNGVFYRYLPCLNIKFIRQICLFIFSFLFTISDILKDKNSVFICDILCKSVTLGTFFAGKLFKRKCFAIVTDRPIDIFKKKEIIYKIQSKFDGYIFLTETMNSDINVFNKPYVIVEGIADPFIKDISVKNKENDKFIIMYAGGLFEKYGIKLLIDTIVKMDDVILELYGTGDMVSYINKLNCCNIIYGGVLENKEIIKREKEVNLLVNPRFSDAEYTKYSFPSKIMEYMSTGTPVLTTKLSGIPKEYDDYLFYIKDETEKGFYESLKKVCDMDIDYLKERGNKAAKFVLNNKSNIIQCKKILEFME